MVALAERHCELGVLANEYGIVGDVLFYSLQACLDSDAYNYAAELSWIRIYSSMLRAILPTVVSYQSRDHSTAPTRTYHQLRPEGMSITDRINNPPMYGKYKNSSFSEDVFYEQMINKEDGIQLQRDVHRELTLEEYCDDKR